jgi:two-component system sensor histidine kinase DesK
VRTIRLALAWDDPLAPAGRRSAALWWLIWILWLPLFIPPVVDLVRVRPGPGRLIVSFTGAAIFFAVYLWTAWQCARRLASPTPPVVATGAARWAPIGVLLALGVALTILNGTEWGALFIYASACAAGWLPARQAAAVIAGIVAFTVVGLGLRGHLADAVSAVAFVVIVGAIVIALVQSVGMGQRLRAEREALARQAAVTGERLRIARDLHDLLGHNLSLIALKSELARRLVAVAPDRAAAEIGDIEAVARQALQEVREAVAGYRQPTLASELLAARELLAAAGIAAQIEGDSGADAVNVEDAFPPGVEAVLGWTVREGITNVIRHSRAHHCTIQVTSDADSACVEISDDGRAAPDGASHGTSGGAGNGLRGLAERVAALGGSSEAGPLPTGGFRLAVVIPLARAGDAAPALAAPAPATTPSATANTERAAHKLPASLSPEPEAAGIEGSSGGERGIAP